MHSLLQISVFSTLLSLWPHSISAAAVNSRPDPLSIIQLNSNVAPTVDTNLSATVPTDFEIIPQTARGEDIPDLTVLNLAVNVVSNLAEARWEQLTFPARKSLNGMTFATGIGEAPAGTQGIQARYIIWTIYRAIQDLIRTGIWKEIIYYMKYRGEIVGSLCIFKTSPPYLSISDGDGGDKNPSPFQQALQDAMPDLSTNNNTFLVTPPLNADLEMVITYPVDPHTPVLGKYSVVIVMLAMLVLGAQQESTEAITKAYGFSIAGFTAQIAVSGPLKPPKKPMTTPPFFKWHDMFTTMKAVATELIGRQYFKSFSVELVLGGVEIGNIHVEPKGGLLEAVAMAEA
ncbi:MAG: hypothetical protein Q9168_006456 [Polycauliona sp. 1 TL-2023]